MTATCDAIVLGLGGFGSAALYHLARRGLRVIGIEQFGIAHDRGSSHGETRIIRKAYFEHPDYVPLLIRAYELWRQLEDETRQSLYEETGLFLAGPPQGETITGAMTSARLHGVRIENLTLSDARRRFPLFSFSNDDAVVFEPEAGVLQVEACVAAHVAMAERHGATIASGETVRSWTGEGNRVRVITDQREYEASRLVIAAGAWSGRVLQDLSLPLQVLRKLLFWQEIAGEKHRMSWQEASCFFFERPYGLFYGFPSLDGETVKLAEHSGGKPVEDPGALDRQSYAMDRSSVNRFVTDSIPSLSSSVHRHAACMYTMSPDGHFIVDRHPEHEQVVFGAGFSGHGFKFTSVIGEALADLAATEETALPIGFLGLDRSALHA